MPARRRPALAVALLTGLAVLWPLAPAQAHNVLVSTDPADGAEVGTPPTQITLTFDDEVLELGSAVEVEGPDGPVADGDARIEDTTVTQPLAADLPAGEYTVSWRVTSADGHPIDGTFAFSAAQGSEPTPEPTTPAPATTEPAAPTAEPPASADAGPQPAEGTDPGFWARPQTWVVAAVLVVLAALVALDRRRVARNRRTRD